MEPTLITAKEAAELAGVTVSTISEWKQKGWLIPFRFSESGVGRPKGLFLKEDIIKLISTRHKAAKELQAKPSIRLDEETHHRLLKIIGQAAINGTRLSMRHVVVGALQQLSDEELLHLAQRQVGCT